MELHLIYKILGYLEGKLEELKKHAEYGVSKEIYELEDVKEYIEQLIENK